MIRRQEAILWQNELRVALKSVLVQLLWGFKRYGVIMLFSFVLLS
jgi:hypothetical protein